MLADFPSQLNQAAVLKKILEKFYILGNFDNLQTFQVYWQIAKVGFRLIKVGYRARSCKTLQELLEDYV